MESLRPKLEAIVGAGAVKFGEAAKADAYSPWTTGVLNPGKIFA